MNVVNEHAETSGASPLGPTGVLSLPLLDRIQIAAPCPARWEEMAGDDKVRHCELCKLNVHNLSAMTRDEAETLLRSNFDADGQQKTGTGRFCAILYRRADGTVLTQNCPVGLSLLRQKTRRALARLAAMVGLTSLAAVVGATINDRSSSGGYGSPGMTRIPDQGVDLMTLQATQLAMKAIGHDSSVAASNQGMLMGRIAAPSLPPVNEDQNEDQNE